MNHYYISIASKPLSDAQRLGFMLLFQSSIRRRHNRSQRQWSREHSAQGRYCRTISFLLREQGCDRSYAESSSARLLLDSDGVRIDPTEALVAISIAICALQTDSHSQSCFARAWRDW